MSFLTEGALLGMEEKAANPAVFKELPLDLNRPILLRWLERTLGYNYTTRALSTPKGFLLTRRKLLVPTHNPDFIVMFGDDDVILYNIQTEQIEKVFEAEKHIQQVAVNADMTKMAVIDGNEISLWDLSTEEKIVTFKPDDGTGLLSIALSPDGKYILAGGNGHGGYHGLLWEISTKKLVKKINATTKWTQECYVAFNPESNKILTATGDGQIVIWDLQGKRLTTCVKFKSLNKCYPLNCALFSPDGRSIIVAGEKGITILDAHTGNIRLTNSDPGDDIDSLAYSPDGCTLIAGPYLIDLKTARILATLPLENLRGHILGGGFTSDGNNIISASNHGILCLHSRLKEEDNRWATTRKETALELYLQLLGKSPDFPLPSCYQVLQNISKDPAFQIFAILAMILAYNM